MLYYLYVGNKNILLGLTIILLGFLLFYTPASLVKISDFSKINIKNTPRLSFTNIPKPTSQIFGLIIRPGELLDIENGYKINFPLNYEVTRSARDATWVIISDPKYKYYQFSLGIKKFPLNYDINVELKGKCMFLDGEKRIMDLCLQDIQNTLRESTTENGYKLISAIYYNYETTTFDSYIITDSGVFLFNIVSEVGADLEEETINQVIDIINSFTLL